MELRKIFKWFVLVVGIVISMFFILKIYFPNLIITYNRVSYIEPIPIPPVISQALQDLINSQSQNGSSENQSENNLPVRLRIPKIDVDTTFEYVGLTPSGAMDVPKGPHTVGWFNLGPRPGDVGSAVVAGHFGWKDNIPAVFDNLHELEIGDKIYSIDEMGVTTTFIVTEIGIYNEHQNAINVFSSNDGKAHLNLITCQGVWNIISKSRPSRLVIFTDKE